MSVKFEADLNSKQFEYRLRLFAANMGVAFRELMKTIGGEMAAKARGRAASAFTSRTGNLLRHIKFFPSKSGGIFTTRDDPDVYKSDAYYSLFVEKGAGIKLKKKKYLVFKINGEWKKVQSARLRPRPFMGPVFDEYWKGPGAKGIQAVKAALEKEAGEAVRGAT
jgi:hypothetical protein